MTNWAPSGQPHTSHTPLKYWAGVLDFVAGSRPRPTLPRRNDQPRVVSYQPPIASSTVVTSGLADGPSGG